jgi:hypothetical protein
MTPKPLARPNGLDGLDAIKARDRIKIVEQERRSANKQAQPSTFVISGWT